MTQKALFLDLDGTLLTDDKQISDGNRRAIAGALERGHRIIITTGRPLVSAVAQAEALGLTSEGCYLIAYNGSILYDTARRKILYRSTLDLDTVVRVFEEAEARGIHIQTYGETKVLVEPRCDDEIIRLYCSRIKMEYEVIDSVRSLTRAPEKMLIIDLRNQEPLNRFRDWILDFAGDRLDLYYSSNEYMEIVEKGMNKGNALKQMAGLLHIPMENTIAAGDAANDLSMIRAAHTGVAMCNGEAQVKEAADYITVHDNNHDGIAEVIETFMT